MTYLRESAVKAITKARTAEYGQHPAEYLAKLKTGPTDARGMVSAIAHMPYPADPLLEPEYAGLTYYQVALMRQAQGMANGLLGSLEFFADRMMGRPAQVNVNVNANETYADFLKHIAEVEEGIIETTAENELGL